MTDRVLAQMYQIETALKQMQQNIALRATDTRKAWEGITYLTCYWQQITDPLITNRLTQYMPHGLKTWARREVKKIPRYMRRLRRLEKAG